MITSPATIVGSANGRSMIALTRDFPANESRTSTQAMIVPKTAVVSTARVALITDSFRAATACGEETTSQKPDQPLPVDFQTTAAIGSTTTTSRNVVTKPTCRERAVEALSLRCAADAGSPGAGPVTALAASAHSERALDPLHDALARVEPLLVDRAPAAEQLVRDRRLARPHRIRAPGLGERLLLHRPVAVLGEDLLGRVRLQKPREGVPLGLVLALRDRRDVDVDQHRLPRDDVRDLPVDRLALEREKDIALARQERVRGVRSRRVLGHDVVLVEPAQVVDRLLVGLAEAALRDVAGEDVPLGDAAGERVDGDGPDAGLQEVVPALDLLRVAVPEAEDDDRVPDDAVVALLVPVPVDETLVDEVVDVVTRVEDDAVGRQAVGHGLTLRRRGAVGRANVDTVPLWGLAELLDQLREDGPGRGVRDEVERHVLRARTCGCRCACHRRRKPRYHRSNPGEPHPLHSAPWSSRSDGRVSVELPPLSIGKL